jgi:hypothetical protein
MTDLSIIPLKNNLLVDATFHTVKSKIITRLNELGITDSKYKNDSEFLALVCNLIEHLIQKKDKINKRDLALDIIGTLFNTTEEEKAALGKNIDFLCSQKGLIKKVSVYKLFKVGIREWFGTPKKS